MNTVVSVKKFLAVLFVWAAFTAAAHASYLSFAFPQNTGTQQQQQSGSIAIDNPNYQSYVYPVSSPAIDVSMWFFDPFGGAYFSATVDTNVAKGTYYVGSFSGGSDVYVTIY